MAAELPAIVVHSILEMSEELVMKVKMLKLEASPDQFL